MKQSNNHARSKRKSKTLKLKAFWKRVFSKRQELSLKAVKPKGKTIYGSVKDIVPHVTELYPKGEYKSLFKTGPNQPNQRQRRKLAAQTR